MASARHPTLTDRQATSRTIGVDAARAGSRKEQRSRATACSNQSVSQQWAEDLVPQRIRRAISSGTVAHHGTDCDDRPLISTACVQPEHEQADEQDHVQDVHPGRPATDQEGSTNGRDRRDRPGGQIRAQGPSCN